MDSNKYSDVEMATPKSDNAPQWASLALQTLELHTDGQWLTIWLNRPKVRNALSAQMATELQQVFRQLATDKCIRGVTLRGRGGVFCAGGDLKGFAQLSEAGAQAPALARQMSVDAGGLFAAFRQLPQLTVALVEGAAMAGGFGLACAADLLLSTNSAKYSLSEVRIGQTPAQIAPYVIERVGRAQARKLMLLATSFDGEQAQQLGLADYVVSADAAAIEQCELQIRSQLLHCSPNAVAATKRVIAQVGQLDPSAMIQYAADEFSACLLSAQGQEGFRAFFEKRAPHWRSEV
ncbi:enoyl-CoA hydratase-related protein [uncultured Ferrimonas sp.]|uniref:enoyl-CoA hydratase/isomerase family protein n=1 Tax=uncultured Ferrimonas sp. TaxID=432640 RepID=UPI00260C7DC0|nr:enoyl-CoA hydratase-related protein [uncultured Ferrimonas sp.]